MPSTRSSFQNGSLTLSTRTSGPDAWVYRWRQTVADGNRTQRKRVVGSLTRYPTKAAARKAVESLRAEINAEQDRLGQLTVGEAWGHFQLNELRDPDVDRSPTTVDLYLMNFRAHILPRWGSTLLSAVKAVDVERWLRGLQLAPATKSKLRNQMSALFSHARRHELIDKNPIVSVRQGAKRLKTPDTLTLNEVAAILENVGPPSVRMMILIAFVTGLRRSEIRGLRWCDLDSQSLWLTLERGCVGRHETKLKTEASRKGLPIPEDLAAMLRSWQSNCLYRADSDWMFASVKLSGRKPVALDTILQKHVRPAVKAAGINKSVGWHTFRHSFATLLGQRHENVKVIQELMRHARSSTTLDLYQQGDVAQKRAAQAHLSESLIGNVLG